MVEAFAILNSFDYSYVILYLISCFLLADFFTGIIHWAEDCYCWEKIGKNAKNKILSSIGYILSNQICDPNLLHHSDQTAFIRNTNFIKLNYITLIIGFLFSFIGYFYGNTFLAISFFISSFGNQFHAWSHKKSKIKLVLLLQDMCIIQTPHQHSKHHKKPYDKCYCSMTNIVNPILDTIKFWRFIEIVLYYLSFKKLVPNNWK